MANVEHCSESQSSCTENRAEKMSKEQIVPCSAETVDIFEYSGQRDLDPNQVECFLTIPNEAQKGLQIERRNKLLCQICKLCFEGSTSKHGLLEHINSIHNFNIYDKGEFCRVCNAVFYTSKALKMHTKTCERQSVSSTSNMLQFSDNPEEINDQKHEDNKKKSENTESNTILNPKVVIEPIKEIKAEPKSFKEAIDSKSEKCAVLMMREGSSVRKDLLNNSFKCYICSKLFRRTRDFRSHIISSHKNELDEKDFDDLSYRCKKCATTFPNITLLRGHFFKKHTALIIYRCIVCHVTLKTKKSLRIHYNNLHARKSKELHSCHECGKELMNLKALKAHIRLKHGQHNNKPGFRCRLCQQKFDTKENRKLHYEEEHLGESPFICTDCGKGFSSKSGLYGHRQLHKTDQPSTCPYCEKIFNRRDSYHEHILIHVGPRHRCPHCPKEFVQRSNLVRHIRIHTGQKPYTCTFCDKRFSDKGACNSHIRVHTKEEQCTCPYCGQTFTKKQKLKYHIRKHTGEGLISCEICSKTFTNAFALKEHRAIHDRQTQTICVECGKAFNSAKYLQRHVTLVHQDPQASSMSFHCPICEKTFCHQTRLKSHIVTHLGKKHLQCLICEKRYSSPKSIRNHLKQSHNLRPDQPEFKKSVRSAFESTQISVNSMQRVKDSHSSEVNSKDTVVTFSFKEETNSIILKSREESAECKTANKDDEGKWERKFYDKGSITCSSVNEGITLDYKYRENIEFTKEIDHENSTKFEKAQEEKKTKSSIKDPRDINTSISLSLKSKISDSPGYKVESKVENIDKDASLCTKTENLLNYNPKYKLNCETPLNLATANEIDDILRKNTNNIVDTLNERTLHSTDTNNELKVSDVDKKPIILDNVSSLNEQLRENLGGDLSAIIEDCINVNEQLKRFDSKDVGCFQVLKKDSKLSLESSKDISRRRKQLKTPKKYVSPIDALEKFDNKLKNIMPKKERVEAIARSLKKSNNLREIFIEQSNA